MFETQLFVGDKIRFAAHDRDQDAETESKWTLDADYLHAIGVRPAYPLSANVIKKQHEEAQKEADRNQLFRWAVRLQNDNRLVGWARIDHIEWTHHAGAIALGIGAGDDRGQGYGQDALNVLLRYAFDELNMHRLRASVPGYNSGALRFFGHFGFVEEVRRREALLLHSQRYDEVWLGLLRRDWRKVPLPSGEGRGNQ